MGKEVKLFHPEFVLIWTCKYWHSSKQVGWVERFVRNPTVVVLGIGRKTTALNPTYKSQCVIYWCTPSTRNGNSLCLPIHPLEHNNFPG